MIQVQAMLYASLAASLFSAFLAMLGKQWLNRYSSTDMRGTGIERSQNRQRKLNGIVNWYFDNVMESLPVMLQVALLLLGCALSRYLWEIEATVAYVVLGVTALGVIFYAFFVVAGAASASCPYQTPGARIIRRIHYYTLHYILPPILSFLRSTFRALIDNPTCPLFSGCTMGEDWICALPACILCFPFLLVYGAYVLARAIVRAPIALVRTVRSWCHRMSNWIRSARSAQALRLNQPVAALDSQCISWILRTSLEKGIRLSTLKFLATMPTLVDFNPALFLDCFDIFIDCIKTNEHNPVIVQGMERLAEASAACFFAIYSHLSIMDPMSSVLLDICQRYRGIFPQDLDLSGLPFPHALGTIHQAIYPYWRFKMPIEWRGHKPTNHKHIAVARAISKLSWFKHQQGQVPSPCLSFAFHYLSQDTLPPPPVIADCLLIMAIDMGCNVPNDIVFGERYAHT
jgi:hypothetical protein